MFFELWDIDTFNMVSSYETESEALADVREAMDRHGIGYVVGLALVQEDANGESLTLAEGESLRRRAQAAAPSLSV